MAVADLEVEFRMRRGSVHAVRGINYTIDYGECLALVGESGAGKSASALALLQLTPLFARLSGSVRLAGQDLLELSERDLWSIRGNKVGIIFQDPASSLNPVVRIGDQVGESLAIHEGASKAEARERAIALLDRVGIADAAGRIDDYPLQFSGGMKQRVMIAIALACSPELLIADEPTTALDVTAQAEILELLHDLHAESGMGMLLISHDLGVVARLADRVAVMYAGKLVEVGAAVDVFARSRHPYTQALLASQPRLDVFTGEHLPQIDGAPPNLDEEIIGCAFRPRCGHAIERCASEDPGLVDTRPHGGASLAACWVLPEPSAAIAQDSDIQVAMRPRGEARRDPIVRVEDVRVYFPAGRRGASLKAVDGVSLEVRRGETLGLVGESGCGKTTLGSAILRLVEPDSGSVMLMGEDFLDLSPKMLRRQRRHAQMVFQDPYSSLSPRMRVGDIVREPLDVHKEGSTEERRQRVDELLGLVGLGPGHATRFPHQLSGGQRQRVAIARALALNPAFLVCDEPVSALDVSIQAQIINLLHDLQEELDLSYLFISHDLSVVRHLADRIVVMYLGQLVEEAPADQLHARPLHPYTMALISAVPVPDPIAESARERIVLEGELPSIQNPPSGCRFRTRCRYAQSTCAAEVPLWRELRPQHWVACHFAEEIENSSAGITRNGAMSS